MSPTHKASKTSRAEPVRKPTLRPIGVIRSRLKKRGAAPMQGYEGAPDAWLEVKPFAIEALEGLAAGSEVIVITWFHRAKRDVLKVYPRSDRQRRLAGVFATRRYQTRSVGLYRCIKVLPQSAKHSWIGSVPPAVAGGYGSASQDIRKSSASSRRTHPLPQVVLTRSKRGV